MKFGEYLQTHLNPEWSSQYIAYDDIKEMFIEVINKIPWIRTINSNFTREEYFLRIDQEFFQYCEKEVCKINTFFIEKLAQVLLQFNILKHKLEYIKEMDRRHHLSVRNVLYPRKIETNIHQNVNSHRQSTEENNTDTQINIPQLKIFNSKNDKQLKRSDLKIAFSEFYLMLIRLKDYQTLNSIGFYKILKKHDKLFETLRGHDWRKLHIGSTLFHTSTEVDQLIIEIESLYSNEFEFGDRTRAIQCLRSPPLKEKQRRIVSFHLGILIGMICFLIPIMIILSLVLFGNHSSKLMNWSAIFHLYRSSFLIILHIIFFGINVYGWSIAGVNHIRIFDFDRQYHLTYQQYLEIGTFLMVIWLISINVFLFTFYFDLYPFLQPFIFIIFFLLFLINPIRICYSKSRWWFLKNLSRVFFAPFSPVKFPDFWLADQLCSLELICFDLEFFFCFYLNGSNWSTSKSTHTFFCNAWTQISLQIVFQSLPSWFRFMQCLRRYYDTKKKFPHLVDAGKYASTFFVIVSDAGRRTKSFDYHNNKRNNPFLYIWTISAFISSTYKTVWDLKIDWGFFDKYTEENKYLRERIIYSRKYYYYIAIIENILFRYIWLINIFVHFNSFLIEYTYIVDFFISIVEIVRRFIWNYFRLENEHLYNCGRFRTVDDISVRPISSIDLDQSMRQTIDSRHTSESNSSEDGTTTCIRTTTEGMNNRFRLISNLYSFLRNSAESILL